MDVVSRSAHVLTYSCVCAGAAVREVVGSAQQGGLTDVSIGQEYELTDVARPTLLSPRPVCLLHP